MIIEVDGESHDNEEQINYDKNRLTVFRNNGFYVLVLRNEEVQTMIYNVKEYVERMILQRYKDIKVGCLI